MSPPRRGKTEAGDVSDAPAIRATTPWDELPIAAFEVDTSGVVLQVNEALKVMFADTDGQWWGEPLSRAFPEEMAARLEAAWSTTADGRLEVESEMGASGSCQHRVEARRSANGWVGTVSDITTENLAAHRREALAGWSKRLHQAASFAELLHLAQEEVSLRTRYRTASLFVLPTPDAPRARMLATSGGNSELRWEHVPEIEIARDKLALELMQRTDTLVIEDARSDPRTNKEIVEALQNRTLIHVPLFLLGERLGVFTTGSYGDVEGVVVPIDDEVAYLEAMAIEIAVAAGRLRLTAQRNEAEAKARLMEVEMLRTQQLERLGLLAGGVAHDVNNLMTVVMGHVAHVITHLDRTSPERARLEEARVAVSRTGELAREMLAYAGHGALENERGDLGEVLDRARELVAAALPAALDLTVELPQPLPVRGDLTQLRQVLVNLLTNAGESAGGRSVAVHLTASLQTLTTAQLAKSRVVDTPSPGDFVVVSIRDEGAGMSDEVRRQLFDPFFTTKGPGRGLGLSAVLGIVQGHGGAVWVDSVLGEGTTLRVALPVASSVSTSPPVDTEARTESGCILIVDDQDMVRRLARLVLEEAGLTVLEASDGPEALEILDSRDDIGVMVLDARMPELSGESVLETARARGSSVRVVFTSGYAPRPEGLPATVDRFLPKPYQPDDLVRVVRELLG